MENCGKNWNEFNEYIVGPKTLLKHYNQCFSLFKWLKKKLVQWFETNNFIYFFKIPLHYSIMQHLFGWKHITLFIKCCHKAVFARFWNL
jgi:hypothetical protein